MNYELEATKEGIIVNNVKDFDLVHIFECGQCFRWLPDDKGGYRGIAFGRAVCVNYDKDSAKLYIRGADEDDFNNIWCDYFDLKTDYGAIKNDFSLKDKYLNASVNFGSGIRLLKQEPFETLISFIISANNNIPRIRKCIDNLSKTYGKPIYHKGDIVGYSFPEPKVLAECTEQEISACCKAGYRCKYIIEASKLYCSSPIDVKYLSDVEKSEARKILSKYMGVGPKVGDCILLFTGARRDVFPVDVWVSKLMNGLYVPDITDRKKIENYASSYFGENAGLAQQYLFYYAREHFDELLNTI